MGDSGGRVTYWPGESEGHLGVTHLTGADATDDPAGVRPTDPVVTHLPNWRNEVEMRQSCQIVPAYINPRHVAG